MEPNNCSTIPEVGTQDILTNYMSGFSGRVFSFFKFDQVIKDTLQNDVVIRSTRKKEVNLNRF